MTKLKFPIRFTKLFISNQFVDPIAGPSSVRELISPVTEKAFISVSEASKADVDVAVKAAKSALSTWNSNYTGTDRRNMLLKVADRIESQAEEFSYLETLCGGKPINEAKQDIVEVVELFRYFAGFADKIHSSNINMMYPNMTTGTRRFPLDVIGIITSFNYPLLLAVWKIAPALAMGNAVLVKPPIQAPLSALLLASIFEDLKFPAGIINVLPGAEGAGGAIASHHDVDKVSFTGSGTVGRIIMKAAADSNLKRVTLELGGKSPVLVFPDADMNVAVNEVYGAIFTNMGENCCAGSRLLIHESIYEEFLQKFKVKVESHVKPGDPLDPQFNFGPLVDKRQFEKVMSFINEAKKAGHKLLTGGERVGNIGYFIQPTVFYDLPDDSLLAREEVFGPVLAVLGPFKTIEEAIERANNTEFGLGAGVFTTNLKTSETCINRIRAGNIWVNTYNYVPPFLPFGGIKGGSGFGKDMGEDAVDEFTSKKSIMISLQ